MNIVHLSIVIVCINNTVVHFVLQVKYYIMYMADCNLSFRLQQYTNTFHCNVKLGSLTMQDHLNISFLYRTLFLFDLGHAN